MRLENLTNENDIFKTNIEKNLIPQIYERIDNGESKIEYNFDETNEILEVNYTLDNLYLKLKSKLVDSDIGVSIKRIPNNSKFIFFRKLNGIKRESDLFIIKFKQEFIPLIIDHLNKNNVKLNVTEKVIKDYMNCNEYNTDNLYVKLKKCLFGTDINVSILKNVTSNNTTINTFDFYRISAQKIIKEKAQKQKERQLQNEIIEMRKEEEEKKQYKKFVFERDNEERKREEEEKKKSRVEIIDEGSKILETIMTKPKSLNDTDIITSCPECNGEILDYDKRCKHCNILLKWE